MATEEGRVVIRCRPYSTFASPPRQLHRNDQEERITHWITATMPWDGDDDPNTRPLEKDAPHVRGRRAETVEVSFASLA